MTLPFYCAQCGGPPRTVEHCAQEIIPNYGLTVFAKRFRIECANCNAVSHNFSVLDSAWRDWLEMQKQLPDKK